MKRDRYLRRRHQILSAFTSRWCFSHRIVPLGRVLMRSECLRHWS
jgi:hypothetical protein